LKAINRKTDDTIVERKIAKRQNIGRVVENSMQKGIYD